MVLLMLDGLFVNSFMGRIEEVEKPLSQIKFYDVSKDKPDTLIADSLAHK